MPNDAIDKAVASAKSTLAEANSKFPPKAKAQTPVATAKPMTAPKPTMFGDPTTAPGIKARQDNVNQYMANAPKMHTGGTVPKTGVYTLKEGEEVVPAGRASEYRKVFEQRGKEGKHKWGGQDSHPQTRQDGGNTPVVGEKHDQKKAAKEGIAEQKE